MDILYSPTLLFGISIISWWLILTPISVYYLRLYYRHRNNTSIRQRHWRIVMALGSICIMFWSIDCPLYFLHKILDSEPQLFPNTDYVHILREVHVFLFPITLYTFTWILSLRYYLIWFDIKFYEETINMSWKVIINNTRDHHSNWFLRHKKRFGSLHWLTPKLVLLILTLSSISICWQYHYPLIAHIMDCIIFFYSIPIILILYHRSPITSRKNEKYLFLDTEMRCILILLSSEWMCFTVGSIIHRIFMQQINDDEDGFFSISPYYDEMVFLFIQSWIGVIFAFCIVLITTKWTMYKCRVQSPSIRNRKRTSRSHRWNISHSSIQTASPTTASTGTFGVNGVVSPSSHSPSPSPVPSVLSRKSRSSKSATSLSRNSKIMRLSIPGRELKLFECLQINDGFICFMNHLMKEFNHECLLSIIEFIQFKHHIARKAMYDSNASNPQYSSNNNIGSSNSNPLRVPSNPLLLHCGYSSTSFEFEREEINAIKSESEVIPNSNTVTTPNAMTTPNSVNFNNFNNQIHLPSDHRPQLTLSMNSYSGTFRSHSASTTAKRREILSVEFPECVPKSFIVFKTKSGSLDEPLSKEEVLKSCKKKAFALFEKYIHCESRSEYEINIDYQMKMGMIQMMGSKGEMEGVTSFGELSVVFDECILEMYDLMCQSYKRFKRTSQFAVLDRKIFSKISQR